MKQDDFDAAWFSCQVNKPHIHSKWFSPKKMYNNNIREQKQHTLAGKQKIASFLENEAHVPLKKYIKNV